VVAAVVLPGLDGDSGIRCGFARALRSFADTDVVTYPAEGVPDYEEARRLVDQAIPSSGSYVLVAESFSGPLACAIAGEKPDGLKGLVLCASFARYPGPWPRALVTAIRALPPSPMLRAALRGLMLGRWSNAENLLALLGSVSRLSAATVRSRLKAALGADARAALASAAVPVLFLRASSDRLVSASAAVEAAALAKSVEVRCIDGPHSLLQVCPDECAQEIGAFIQHL
jgi:pimeloyl-[acyl-carrier protein] methyl ester esterase